MNLRLNFQQLIHQKIKKVNLQQEDQEKDQANLEVCLQCLILKRKL